jgi:hypothetical protein
MLLAAPEHVDAMIAAFDGSGGRLVRHTLSDAALAGLRVYPPGQTASNVVPFPFRACSRTGQSNLLVRAMQKA